MLVCRHLTGSARNVRFKKFVCPSYVYPGEQSQLYVLSSASFFSCFCWFDFSCTLSSAQASLDFTRLGRQINRWKASAAAIRNTNDEENFQM